MPLTQVPAAAQFLVQVHSRPQSPEIFAAHSIAEEAAAASSEPPPRGGGDTLPAAKPGSSSSESPPLETLETELSERATPSDEVQQAFEKVDAWAERGFLNTFRNPGIERSFQNYVGHLWFHHFFRWLVVVAAMFTLGPVLDLAYLALGMGSATGRASAVPHVYFRWFLYFMCGALWLLALAFALQLHYGSHLLHQRIARGRERLMAIFSAFVVAGLTFPILCSDDASIAAAEPTPDW